MRLSSGTNTHDSVSMLSFTYVAQPERSALIARSKFIPDPILYNSFQAVASEGHFKIQAINCRKFSKIPLLNSH